MQKSKPARSEPSGPVPQRHSLATGQGLTPPPPREDLVNSASYKQTSKKQPRA